MALCAVTTHDLPTIYGFWSGRDLEVKKALGMFRDEDHWKEQLADRERDKRLILSALANRGIIPDSRQPQLPEMSPALCLAIYRYLAMTPCTLVLASLDDILGTFDQQNMPGTIDEQPNWLRKTPFSREQMVSDRRFVELADMFRKETGTR
jgi:(1->4)-alpha-D-glucan 1-alpha-D-glucosylmutase